MKHHLKGGSDPSSARKEQEDVDTVERGKPSDLEGLVL